jgi:hypothetical protein
MNSQTTGFLILEVIINTVMIAEVITRFLALRKVYKLHLSFNIYSDNF